VKQEARRIDLKAIVKAFAWAIAGPAPILVLAAACNDPVQQSPAQGAPQQASGHGQDERPDRSLQLVDPDKLDFLPLAAGNNWTYVKRVPPGRRAFVERSLRLKDQRLFVTTGESVGVSGAVHCTETYTVVRNAGGGEWEISVRASPRECSELTHGPRDGRYLGAVRTAWMKRLMASPGMPTPGEEVLGYIQEKLTYDRDGLPPGWRDDVTEPVEETRVIGVIWKALPPPGQSFASVELRSLAGTSVIRGSDTPVSLQVPAGSFSNCIETKEDVSRSTGRDLRNPSETGWTRRSHFCPNVGLVKEVETNRAGDVLYSMDLETYRLSP
jgi:hypothetical protein